MWESCLHAGRPLLFVEPAERAVIGTVTEAYDARAERCVAFRETTKLTDIILSTALCTARGNVRRRVNRGFGVGQGEQRGSPLTLNRRFRVCHRDVGTVLMGKSNGIRIRYQIGAKLKRVERGRVPRVRDTHRYVCEVDAGSNRNGLEPFRADTPQHQSARGGNAADDQ